MKKAGYFSFFIFLTATLFWGWMIPREQTPYLYPELLHFPKMLPSNNSPTVEGVTLGRFLFYDSILSRDSSLSCSGCHKQEFAFSDAPNIFSKGVNGTLNQRNTLPLFNLVWSPHFHWDGKATSIEDQVLFPVQSHSEMDLDWKTVGQRIRSSEFYRPMFLEAFGDVPIDSITIAKAIAQFERTLISHNSKYDQVLRGETYFTSEEYKGFNLINDQTKGNCLHCHTTDANALGTTFRFSNNGLDNFLSVDAFEDKGRGVITGKDSDVGLFKIPSLRNLALTAPYMHDGRFQTLEEVLDFYTEGVQNSLNIDTKMEFKSHQKLNLTSEEKLFIIDFLNTLTDSVFINDPKLSNPFM